jgi:hypothetical protein
MSAEAAAAAAAGSPSNATSTSTSSTSKIQALMAMGYPEGKCTTALRVAGGDMEQAVGFLLMGDKSQRGFDFSFEESITSSGVGPGEVEVGNETCRAGSPVVVPLTAMEPHGRNVVLPPMNPEPISASATFATGDPTLEDQLMNMGYGRNQAKLALRVAQGDLEQAANFLLMGDSRAGFVSDSSLRNLSMTDNDAAVAAAMQEEALFEHARSTQHEQYYHQAPPTGYVEGQSSALPPSGPRPKIVATQTFLTTPGAGTFCTCVAASRFLMGGVVSATFLNNIMEVAIELYRKSSGGNANALDNDNSVESVIRKFGRSHLGIQVIRNGEVDPKHGVFMPHDLQHDMGIRKLLSTCRNEQQAGWQVLVVELKYDSFCVSLPPKGTSNKFWFLDFLPRTIVRAPGAYALVHSSLMQMEESMEAVFRTIAMKQESEFLSFTVYRIKKLG